MKIFIDESGDFNLKDDSVSVLVSIIIPENKEQKLENLFLELNSRVTKDEMVDNEIKGYLLSSENVEFIFQFLKENSDFKITIHILDHELISEDEIKLFRAEQTTKLRQSKERYIENGRKSEKIITHLEEMIRWTERNDKISNENFLEFFSMFYLTRDTFQKILMYYHQEDFLQCFDGFFFYIDRKNIRITKSEKYISGMILDFLENDRSKRELFDIHESLTKEEHPMSKFSVIGNNEFTFDVGKMFKDGLKFLDSKENYGIQIADVVASSIRRMLLNKLDKKLFDLIRNNAAYYKNNFEAVNIIQFVNYKKITSKRNILSYIQKAPSIHFNLI